MNVERSSQLLPDALQTAFLFPGQGVQYFHMAASLFEGDVRFNAIMRGLDQALIADGQDAVLPRLYAGDVGRDTPCGDVRFTHPALLMTEMAVALRLRAGGTEPDVCVGNSLGEYAAAAVADVVTPEAMLCAISRSAKLLHDKCPAGRMLSVMAPLAVFKDLRDVELAGEQAEDHFVISGSDEAIERVRLYLAGRDILCVSLPVTRAFHNSAMDVVQLDLMAVFQSMTFRAPRCALISSMTGQPVRKPDAAHFGRIGRMPVNFRQAVQSLAERGAVHRLIDVGPSGSLVTLAVRNLPAHAPNWPQVRILSPFIKPADEVSRLNDIDRMGKDRMRDAEPETVARVGGAAVVFAGQGSQIKGMGLDLFARFPDMRAQADCILGYSVVDMCRDDPGEKLSDTRFTQPLVFCVNAMAYRAYREEHSAPAFLAGHSLGEMNALLAAGVMDFETGLRVVQQRATLMAETTAGAMAAVIGLDRGAIENALAQNGLDRVDLANINTSQQLVISGAAEQLAKARSVMEEAGAKACIPLPVSGAFHSRLMQVAEHSFHRFLQGITLQPPTIPVISNVNAQPYAPDDIAGQISRLLSRSVDWVGCVTYMLDHGVTDFVELSPKPVLSGMVREIRAAYQPLAPQRAEEAQVVPKEKMPVAPVQQPSAPKLGTKHMRAETLGSHRFRAVHNTRYAHICGGMVHGIASVGMVAACAEAGILSFFGTGGLSPDRVEQAIIDLQRRLGDDAPFGFNLLNGSNEAANIDLFLRYGIHTIEASAFVQVTPDLVRYRLTGLSRDGGGVHIGHKIVAKLSRPEVARSFLAPAPVAIVQDLLARHLITPEMADLAAKVPMADDICVESDSGGHTDQGNATVLIPAIRRQRDLAQREYGYADPVRIGAGGGVGTPEAAVSALVLGAQFTLTGSINQCTVEAGTSGLVKEMLAACEVQDTTYAPAGDMFEIGARVQVLRRGLLFPARANRLFDLYIQHDSLEAIPPKVREQIEIKYFQRSFDDVWHDCQEYWPADVIDHALRMPKQRMAYVFRWYFGLSGRLALQGDASRKVDFQIHCGPAMGAFNQWVTGTDLEGPQNRSVEQVNRALLDATADRLGQLINDFQGV